MMRGLRGRMKDGKRNLKKKASFECRDIAICIILLVVLSAASADQPMVRHPDHSTFLLSKSTPSLRGFIGIAPPGTACVEKVFEPFLYPTAPTKVRR